jgi:uncharacterized protein YcnI
MNRSGPTRRALRRTATIAAAGLAAVLLLASPAAAHTEIDLDNATAGATNVTMSVNAEAESTKAGIASVAVRLPAGLTPNQVSLVTGPSGWTLSPTSDGYQVAGTALKTGVNAQYKIKIAQLPATPGVLTFKTVVTYANGDADSWIGAPGADNPAPTVSLAPGAASSATASPSPSASNSPATAVISTAGASQPADQGGWPAWATWLIVLAVLAAAVVSVIALRRRRTPPPTA